MAKKVKFYDGTEIEVLTFSMEPFFSVYFESQEELRELWSFMDTEFLSRLEVFEDETKMTEYVDCSLMRVEASIDPKYGQTTGHFYLLGTQVPFTDPEYEVAYNILMNS